MLLLAPRRRLSAAIRRLLSDRSGVAAIELAAVAGPIVVGMVVGIDLAVAIATRNKVNHAAQAGIQYALANGFDADKMKAAASSSVNVSGLTFSNVTKFCGCPGTTGVTAVTCGSNCSIQTVNSGTISVPAASYAQITVQKNFSPMFKFNQLRDGDNTVQDQILKAKAVARLM